MRAEIKRLQMDMGITSIYVTHDQVEAMTMADRVAVMKDGVLQAYSPPDELYDQPRTLFVAGFVGSPPMNFVDVEVVRENGDYHARREGFDVAVPAERGEKAASRGNVTLGIRPEDITIADEGVSGEIYVVEPLGRDDLVNVRIGDANVHVLADPTLGLKMGQAVTLGFNTHKVQFFDPQTEKSLLWTG
jgi:ABC-type sugar transport system ATPase subunit